MNLEISTPPDQKNQLLGLKAVESPDRGVLCLDESGVVRFANRRVAEMFGLPVDEIVGLRYDDLVHGLMPKFSEPERFYSRCMDLLREGSSVGEDVFETLDGGAILHRYSTPVVGRDGISGGRVEIYSDITFRRRLEREIVERNRELARLNEELRAAQEQLVQSEKLRVLGEMSAGVAHDLNNVLGAVLANVQLLMRDNASEQLKDGLEAIELAALDGAETVRRIRELAKVGGENVFLRVDLSDVVNDVVRVLQPTWQNAESSGPQVEVATELFPTPGVIGNPPELREALANVVLNAVEAMPDGGKIVLATGIEGEAAYLSVTDNGTGMSEDAKRRLFDPFFTTRGAAGTGLGMSIVHAIVTRHGGHIEVDSEEGEGTQIKIMLPSKAPVTIAEREDEPAPTHRNLRLLVLHGEEMLGAIIVEMLTEIGHEGVIVTSPTALQTCCIDEDFDVILIDEAMLEDVPSEVWDGIPVVTMVSASGDVGADLVLRKPVKMDDLRRVLEKVLQDIYFEVED